jgi:MOSC domain-containing protein YiiM
MRVVSINVGRPRIAVHEARRYSTAIAKRPVAGPVNLTITGFEGDRVSDGENHGGPDQAVCCYPQEHYEYWRGRLAGDLAAPAFGENLTTAGLLETQVCIGDTYRFGSAVVQVSQPRQPCWKLAAKHRAPDLPRWINRIGYTGFYLRVLEPGLVSAADEFTLLEHPHPDVTVALTSRTRLTRAPDRETLTLLAALPELSASWRKAFRERLRTASEE